MEDIRQVPTMCRCSVLVVLGHEDALRALHVPGLPPYAPLHRGIRCPRSRRLRCTPIQNEEHAEFVNHLTDQSGAVFDTAGSQRGGQLIYVTMQLPDSMAVGGTDCIELNIAALPPQRLLRTQGLITPVRWVCANTQAAALSNHVSSNSIRYTAGTTAAVQAACDVLGLTFEYCAGSQAEA